MNFSSRKELLTLSLALVLAGCSKTAAPTAETADATHIESTENIVALSKASLQHLTLATETVHEGNLGLSLRTIGRLSLNQNHTFRIASNFEGRLLALSPDLNERVQPGTLIATLECPDLLGKNLELRSTMEGIVLERLATVGEFVEKGRVIATIGDNAQLWLLAEINERDLSLVKSGQEAEFTVLAYPDKRFHGRIAQLGNQVEHDSRTLEARIEVDNKDGLLKAGMFADIAITTTVLERVLTIPDKAMQSDGDSQVVFVALGADRFEKRRVQPGVSHQERTQVISGLKTGEIVVTDGSFILKSELLKGQLGEE